MLTCFVQLRIIFCCAAYMSSPSHIELILAEGSDCEEGGRSCRGQKKEGQGHLTAEPQPRLVIANFEGNAPSCQGVGFEACKWFLLLSTIFPFSPLVSSSAEGLKGHWSFLGIAPLPQKSVQGP